MSKYERGWRVEYRKRGGEWQTDDGGYAPGQIARFVATTLYWRHIDYATRDVRLRRPDGSVAKERVAMPAVKLTRAQRHACAVEMLRWILGWIADEAERLGSERDERGTATLMGIASAADVPWPDVLAFAGGRYGFYDDNFNMDTHQLRRIAYVIRCRFKALGGAHG